VLEFFLKLREISISERSEFIAPPLDRGLYLQHPQFQRLALDASLTEPNGANVITRFSLVEPSTRASISAAVVIHQSVYLLTVLLDRGDSNARNGK